MYKRYAKDLGITWQSNWNNDQSILWDNIPNDIELKLREYSKQMYRNAKKIIFPNKHKYAFVLGRDKRETKELRKLFESLNDLYEYPKERGDMGSPVCDSFGNQFTNLDIDFTPKPKQYSLFDLP